MNTNVEEWLALFLVQSKGNEQLHYDYPLLEKFLTLHIVFAHSTKIQQAIGLWAVVFCPRVHSFKSVQL